MPDRLRNRLREVLRPRTVSTRLVEVRPRAIESVPRVMQDLSLWRHALLVADPRTWAACGESVEAALRASGTPATRLILEPDCVRDEWADQVAEAVRARPRITPIAIGSGTVNDIVKLGCEQVHAPYLCVASAPSMNGYPSPISAVLREGVKRTVPAAPPLGIFHDLEVMGAAPPAMIGSGYADLLAKPTSISDWILARELAGESFQAEPLRILEGVTEEVVRVAPRIREPDAVGMETLSLGLALSGLSMAAAGSSQPASGAEHLISHWWDMIGHRDGWQLDLHGRQVGVATILIAGLYERLLALPSEAMVAPGTAGDAAEREDEAIPREYGSLADSVLPETREKRRAAGGAGARLARARERWGTLREGLRAATVTPSVIREQLAKGGAPTTLAEIGRTREEGRRALLFARFLRRRYTSLDLADELGLLEGWSEELLDLV